MSGIYQRQINSATVKNPSANQTLISVDETGKIFTKDSSGNVTVYPTTGGGGSFTGGTVTGEAIFTNGLSANTMSSSTLNVNYSDTFTFGVDENFSQPIREYIGGWVGLPVTGNSIGSKIDFVNNEIYDTTIVGSTGIPAFGVSFPTLVSGQFGFVNDGILSGSSVANGVTVFDQSGLGGGVSINNAIRTVINNTLSGSNISYEVGTSLSQNDEFSQLTFGKTNEAGEIIQLSFNDGESGLNVSSDLTDPEAELFRIIDTSVDFKDRLLVRKDLIRLNHTNGDTALGIDVNGVFVNAISGSTGNTFSVIDDEFNSMFNVNQTYGVTVNAISGNTGSTFTVTDDEFNRLFSVNQYVSGSYDSQVDCIGDSQSLSIFRVVTSGYTNTLFSINQSGSTTINSIVTTGSKGNIFTINRPSGSSPINVSSEGSTSLLDTILYFSNSLPTSSSGLTSGQIYTQTSTELGGSGTTKVLCIV